MSKILGWVKEHPVAAGSILAGGVVLLIIVLFSGGKSAPQSTAIVAQPLSDTGQNTALQVAQLQAGIQQNAISTQGATDLATIAAAKETALKNSDVSLANIYATADTTKFVATLGAQVANNQTEAAKDINAANVSAATQISQINTSAQLQVAGLQKDMAFNDNATQLALGQLSASVALHSLDLDNQYKNSALFSANQITRELSNANRLGGVSFGPDGTFSLATANVGTIGWVGPKVA